MNTITTTRTIGALAITASALGMGLGAAPAAQAANGPNMQLPFPCGEVWNGNNGNSSAHRTPYETDFNWGSSAEADRGKPVVAAAAGTVVKSEHRGEKDGYGNLVVINHGSYSSYYAHLDRRNVSVGQKVSQGQLIGKVGRTTKASRAGMSSHLHFEVRTNGGSWPSNIVRPVFNGKAYYGGDIKSANCNGKPPTTSIPAYPGASAFQLGKSNPNVLTLDKALIKKGYTRHHDGNGYQAGSTFTKYTLLNVQDFQKAQGWSGTGADGYPGPKTWELLLK